MVKKIKYLGLSVDDEKKLFWNQKEDLLKKSKMEGERSILSN